MKTPTRPQPATSLPRAPKEDAGKRSTTYLIMMGIRLVCFALVLFVTPYSWYTWVFAAMAIFLPYLAVVVANVSANMTAPTALGPERMIEAARAEPVPRAAAPATRIIRIDESPQEPSRDR